MVESSCTQCGAARSETGAFCPVCGARFAQDHGSHRENQSIPMPAAGGRRTSALDSLIELGPGVWSLICAGGMAIGAVLPWAETRGFVSLSVGPLSGLGKDLGLTLGAAGAAVALGAGVAMAAGQAAADGEVLRPVYGGAAVLSLVGVGWVLLEFIAHSQGSVGLLTPGIGLLVTGVSGLFALIAMRTRGT